MAKPKQVYSWGDIPQETFEAFYKAVEKLREEMIPRDCDRDHPIDLLIVNRMVEEPIGYLAVPKNEVYSYVTHGYLKVHPDKQQEMTDETERALTANVAMAASALERYMRLKQHHNSVEREAKRPIADRINDACPLCKKKVPVQEQAFCHDNGEECKAVDLRRLESRKTKPTEPRWCMNQECRCKLPEYASKKGRKDRNICINPRCGLDNSKHYPEADNV